MDCLLGGFIVRLNNYYKFTEKQCQDYKYTIQPPKTDIAFDVTVDEITEKRVMLQTNLSYSYLENMIFHFKLAEWLPTHNAFVLHSAVFDVEGTGIALAAHSGTGKTTHMLLWQKLLGKRLKIVNGDKPIVRFFADEPEIPYAYGTPWNGKEHLGCNMRTPLRHIAFIERSEHNSCEQIAPEDAVNLIFNQVYMPKEPFAAAKTIELINRLISCCKLWKISCNMEPEAAEVAYNKIMEDKNETEI